MTPRFTIKDRLLASRHPMSVFGPPPKTPTVQDGVDGDCNDSTEQKQLPNDGIITHVLDSQPYLERVTDDIAPYKHHCNLSRAAVARNAAGMVASMALGTAVTTAGGMVAVPLLKAAGVAGKLATAGGTEVIKGGAAKGTSMKLGVGAPLPQLWKCTEYLGFQHLRDACVVPVLDPQKGTVKLVDKGLSWTGTVKRGNVNAKSDCFCAVWSTLSWSLDEPANQVRIIIVPSTLKKPASVAYEAKGAIFTRIEWNMVGKTMGLRIRVVNRTVVTQGKNAFGRDKRVNQPFQMKEVVVPVNAFDRIVYVWCGYRPTQTIERISHEAAKINREDQYIHFYPPVLAAYYKGFLTRSPNHVLEQPPPSSARRFLLLLLPAGRTT